MKVHEMLTALQKLDPDTELADDDDPVMAAELVAHLELTYPEGWPQHDFVAALGADPESPDALCSATIHTATPEKDGYSMITQCAFPQKTHTWSP